MSGPRRDGAVVVLVALAARLALAAFGAERFPPAADGTFYHRIAERVAGGLGYTWLWPDGAVTYAAHYPVGYPALLGGAYAVFGAHPGVAMALNAFVGALGVLAVHRLLVRATSRRVAFAGALAVALHPGLVAYTPALMTEGVTGSLLATAAWTASWARERATRSPAIAAIGLGVVVGLATLVRPQVFVLAPAFALVAFWRRPAGARGRAALVATLAALSVCAPWTARNCVRMQRCALVSVNGGWNLLIGANAEATGTWAPVEVPAECRTVWDEAEKDACFERAARRYVREHPRNWLGLVPKKVAATFDYAGAAGWYLHASNPGVFDTRAKVALGALETLYERFALLFALGFAASPRGPRFLLRSAVALVSGVFVFGLHASGAYVGFALAALLRGPALFRGPLLPSAAVAVLAATIATHAVFFGAGRYSLVVFPLITAVGALAFRRSF